VAAFPTRRRVVLAAAAALPLAAVSGCDGLRVLGSPPPPPGDVVLLQGAIAAEKIMVDRYRTVLSAGFAATLAAELNPLLTQHETHLAQLRSRLVVPAGSAASVSPSPSPTPRAGQPVPDTPAAAVAFLSGAEQAAATAMLERALRAPAWMAQLFASISASEATHVPVLAQ
jgi:hypothetical protein